MTDSQNAPLKTVYRLIRESKNITGSWYVEHSLLELDKSGGMENDIGHFNCILYPKFDIRGTSFKLELIVTGSPLPTVRFEKQIFHPYVDEHRFLCLPVKEKCNLDIQKNSLAEILEYIKKVFLMQERSDNDECYNAEALKMYRQHQVDFFLQLAQSGA